MRYDSSNIGINAGKIWNALSKNGAMNVSGLEKETGLKKEDIYLSLGWLFKEDKLTTEEKGRVVKFLLK